MKKVSIQTHHRGGQRRIYASPGKIADYVANVHQSDAIFDARMVFFGNKLPQVRNYVRI